MKTRSRYRVSVGSHTVDLNATSVGNAARLAFRALLNREPRKTGNSAKKLRPLLKRQPRSDYETGGWKGVSVERLGAAA